MAIGIKHDAQPWGNANKATSVGTLQRLMREGRLAICPDPKTREQLLNYAEKRLPSGGFTYSGATPYDDRAQAIITLGIAINRGMVAGTEAWVTSERTEIPTSWDDSGGARIVKHSSP